MRFIYTCCLLFLVACSSRHKAEPSPQGQNEVNSFTIYSKHVRDSFVISIYLPGTVETDQPKMFPVVYMLDANLYFDIYASIVKKYSEVGLLPPVAIVGIGYSSFARMDSLRQRDYTFPVGLPEYEMPVSGKADAFLDFIQEELVPVIDQKYPVDHTKRILHGHSLGGYFALYALSEALKKNTKHFAAYIAASPSLHYNHNYLLSQFDSIPGTNNYNAKVYASFGELEKDTLLQQLKVPGSQLKTATFSELDHMDTQIPTFIKGLQWVTAEPF